MNNIWITYVFCHSYKMSLAHPNSFIKLFPHAQLVKNLPAMQETTIWFLGLEDSLEKG